MSLPGCSILPNWLGGGADRPKPAELAPNPNLVAVRQAWVARVGKVDFPMQTSVQGNVVTVASSDGTVAAFDATSGQSLWRAMAGGALSAGVGSDGKVAAVVTRENEVVALADGRVLWRQKLGALSATPPLVAGGRVFVLAADRSVSAFDGQTGNRLWTQQRTTEALVLRQAGVMLAVGDTLVVGQAGRLAGLNPANGSVRWDAPLATSRGTNDVERLVDLVGRTSRDGSTVCARAFQSAVGCVDTARGTVRWTKAANGTDGLDGDTDRVYGAESDGRVVAWRRETGDRAWTIETLKYRGLTAPLVIGRSVAIGDAAGFVHLLSREDGSLLSRVTVDGSGIATAPLLAGNTMVVVTRNGGVHGYVPQ